VVSLTSFFFCNTIYFLLLKMVGYCFKLNRKKDCLEERHCTDLSWRHDFASCDCMVGITILNNWFIIIYFHLAVENLILFNCLNEKYIWRYRYGSTKYIKLLLLKMYYVYYKSNKIKNKLSQVFIYISINIAVSLK
jgi:hypothetical protein